MDVGPKEGALLVKYARESIKKHFDRGEHMVPAGIAELKEKRGAFVTLERYPGGELRGCIGYIEPVFPLVNAICNVAVSAAFNDPRFPPLAKEELDNIIVEITVLTVPELITVENPQEYPQKIKIGMDGLIVERGYFKGLLLPQVPVEWGWNESDFLSQTCVKAGLEPYCWKKGNCKIYKFQGQIFTETKPNGEVVQKKLA